MRKGKNIALLLLAAGIIAACALLPGVVASYQDSTAIGQPHFETVPNIQLQIRGEEESPAMAKLAMMARMDSGLEISKSMASMTQEQAEARFYEILQEYIDAGLAESFDAVVYESRCMLASVTLDPSLNGVFWMITLISGDDQNFAQFDAAIDDDSGQLLAVSYTGDRVFSEVERAEMMRAFTDLYFRSLEIPDYTHFISTELDGAYVGENSCAARYHYVDDVYGEITADLYVNEYGFYTEFPNRG